MTAAPTIFDTCRPRPDVLAGAAAEADFAADLARTVGGGGAYADPARFFADTWPTRGLKSLLASVLRRLGGDGGEAAIFRLDTSFGGGKTHGLIALVHAARGMQGVAGPAEFIGDAPLPRPPARVAAFDGVNADPANGRAMGDGIRARTPWGEIACALAGPEGYERVRASDETGVAPGRDTLRELFGGEPALVLLDELAVWLRKAGGLDGGGGGQLTAFLSALFQAVQSQPDAAAVFTLAVGKDGSGTDAYAEENRRIADGLAEAASVAGRTATLLNPTAEDETARVLRRRLFESIEEEGAAQAADAYRALWAAGRDALPDAAARPEAAERLREGYPFHPDLLDVLTGKTATLGDFQRVRGMLRLLAAAVKQLWEEKPDRTTAIHLHHIDPGREPVRREIVTRLNRQAYDPAIDNDIAAPEGRTALAQAIDAERHAGMPPYAAWTARTIFMHTLAFNDQLKGVDAAGLRYSILAPGLDGAFIDAARKAFAARSAYLDDRPAAPLRFLAEANLTRIVQQEEARVDAGAARAELDDRIRGIFDGETFDLVPFPAGPFDAPDEAGGRPKLVVLSFDAAAVGGTVDAPPELAARIFARKGADGAALRVFRNNLAFVAADAARLADMRRAANRRLALRELKRPERLAELAEHQRDRVRELEARSEHELAIAVQQCYRHVFYPSRSRIGESDVDLAHTAIDIHSAADKPGAGQAQTARALRDMNELRLPEDEPDSPVFVRERTPLKKGEITTRALRDEFRRDPGLPMLVGDDVFLRGVRLGVERGDYVYRGGDLLCGPGDPQAAIRIDEQSFVLTMDYAKRKKIWPRAPEPEPGPPLPPPGPQIDAGAGDGGAAPPPAVPAGAFSAEGVLPEALARCWEQARAKKAERIGKVAVRVFDANDGFALAGAVGAISGAEKVVIFEGGYETAAGGELHVKFRGPPADAQPVREFLAPQLRAAVRRDLTAELELAFADGLPLAGDAAEKFAERLSRFARAAHVAVTAVARAAAEGESP